MFYIMHIFVFSHTCIDFIFGLRAELASGMIRYALKSALTGLFSTAWACSGLTKSVKTPPAMEPATLCNTSLRFGAALRRVPPTSSAEIPWQNKANQIKTCTQLDIAPPGLRYCMF